jgi:5-methylcytosine-specific restriction endonuclease McrA
MTTWTACDGAVELASILIPSPLVGCGKAERRRRMSTAPARGLGISVLSQRHESHWIRGFICLNTPTVQDAERSGVIRSEGDGRNALLQLWHEARAGNRSESTSQSTHEYIAERLNAWDNQQGGVRWAGGSSPATVNLKLRTYGQGDSPLRAIILRETPGLYEGILYPKSRTPGKVTMKKRIKQQSKRARRSKYNNPMLLPDIPSDESRCKAITKKGKRCKGWAGFGGFCHIHDPNGLYQQNKPKNDKDIPYKLYLQTEHWQKKRKEVLEYFGYRCADCGRENVVLHCHHLTYDNLWNEDPTDFLVLCVDCHKKHHETNPTGGEG